MTPEEQERRYEQLMGRKALERQKLSGKTRCSYCGGRDGQHSQMCKRRKT